MFYRAEFNLTVAADMFLNVEQLGKGASWGSSHPLVRLEHIGPAGTLYVPGAWLHQGINEISVFDLNGGSGLSVSGQGQASYYDPKPEKTTSNNTP